jgi:hypothetical protein
VRCAEPQTKIEKQPLIGDAGAVGATEPQRQCGLQLCAHRGGYDIDRPLAFEPSDLFSGPFERMRAHSGLLPRCHLPNRSNLPTSPPFQRG